MWSKGKRSRNKASVGEPADGSLRVFYSIQIKFAIVAYARLIQIAASRVFTTVLRQQYTMLIAEMLFSYYPSGARGRLQTRNYNRNITHFL